MSTLIIGIGIPGSGKTTLLKALALEKGYAYISTDDLREEIAGKAMDHSRNSEVISVMYIRTAESLSKNGVVVDALFTNPIHRREFLAFARAHGAKEIQGIFFDTPVEVAKERNQKRDRKAKDEAIDRRFAELQTQLPVISDGFDSLVTADEYKQVIQ